MRPSSIVRLLALVLLMLTGGAQAQVCSPVELQRDVRNCGTCGNDCNTLDPNSVWTCQAGNCQRNGCRAGFYDLVAPAGTCETACTYTSATELCNGLDDDCDGSVDEAPLVSPAVTEICGVSPAATGAECTTNVARACVSGSWQCTFPANVCTGGNCAATPETCDTVDNNCNGQLNENVPNFGRACASDDGLPPGSQAGCRTSGTYVCSGPNAVACSATPASCTTLPGGCAELCDGIDNDCDGAIDENKTSPGAAVATFVRPEVTRVNASLWITTYEINRRNANAVSSGFGNGYRLFANTPPGTPVQSTVGCSVPARMPWTDVGGREAEEICAGMGGTLCTATEWRSGCRTPTTCTWGYNPRGAACTTAFTAAKFCNIAPSYDFSVPQAGDQDGLLTSGNTGQLQNCWADWSGLQGNVGTSATLFDMTGNVRELSKFDATSYMLRGGSTLSWSEASATCAFDVNLVDGSFQYRDTGLRCCFSTDPR